MLISALLIACGGKQAEPEAPIDEPAVAPAEDAPAEDAPAEDVPTEGAPAEDAVADGTDASDEEPGADAASEGDCAAGAVIYSQQNVPLRAPDDAAMRWTLTVHDTGYWNNTAPNGETTGCLSGEELTNIHADMAAADIAAPELAPGMVRCMAMPMTEYTVTIGEQSATWKGPCGMNNPTESLSALMTSIGSLSYNRE